ncbi:MAG: ribosome silencing factor [Prevotella sp.]|uniref:ribosome silencing factor n=1 Tax=Prevotella sp. TaxID=59823 RepID=UPI00257C21F4|nr:ribosome silencing factor [Prevotella sp.]MBS5875109.1 ribosome silencing factor [Prevotella sp.]
MEQTKNLVETITKGIQEKKGSNINIIDLSGIEGTICHYFIICQGNSPSQVEAITDSVEEFARVHAGEKPVHVVGLNNAQWVAMDYTDVMVHIFLPEVREYYNLENLWEDAKQTRIPNLD